MKLSKQQTYQLLDQTFGKEWRLAYNIPMPKKRQSWKDKYSHTRVMPNPNSRNQKRKRNRLKQKRKQVMHYIRKFEKKHNVSIQEFLEDAV